MSTADRTRASGRWEGYREPLSWRGARTLYNVADAMDGAAAGVDVAPAVARALRHAGPGAARATAFWLALLDWEPVATGRARRRFWRLPREERAAALARWRASRWPPRRRAWQRLAGWIEGAVREGRRQSSEGA